MPLKLRSGRTSPPGRGWIANASIVCGNFARAEPLPVSLAGGYLAALVRASMASIVVKSLENGPNLILVDGATVGAFCRCGHTGHRPKCDGTHQKIGYQAPAAEIKITE